jgi:aerobic C4-dicarboxylate transport protein
MESMIPTQPYVADSGKPKRDRTSYLYIAVIIAVLLGVFVGLVAPDFAKGLKPMGTMFVNLIKMMISPIIFCTIVLGIGSVRAAATVGKAGAMALGYFLTMSTFALGIGLLVGNLVHPGDGLVIPKGGGDTYAKQAESAGGIVDFIQGIIPNTLVSALTAGNVLQTLFVALLAGFAIQRLGKAGDPIIRGIGHLQKLVFRILGMILWVAPLGAFGAISAVVGQGGWSAIGQLMKLMLAFYITCTIFVFVVLWVILKSFTGVNALKLYRYLAREFLLILATSSSESALPNLMAKMEHAGVDKGTVGIVVPTGYSFNLDGTAIYLTMSTLFIANAMGKPMSIGEKAGLLAFMIIASKGAAAVTGGGLATLAGGIQAYRPDMLDGVGVVVGVDRFMSEARALTNFAGNSVATILVGKWTNTVNLGRVHDVLDGFAPFDYGTMTDTHDPLAEDSQRHHHHAHVPTPIDPAEDLQPTPMAVLPGGEHHDDPH